MYNIFMNRLNRFLILNYRITSFGCNVFEETLLRMAGIKTLPKTCYFGSKDGDKSILLEISGITFQDFKIFQDYLKQYGNVIASMPHFSPCQIIIETNVVYKKIFPHFIAYWKNLEKTPEGRRRIEAYLAKCHWRKDLTYYQLYQDITRMNQDILPSSMDVSSINTYFFAKQRLLNALLVSAYAEEDFDLKSSKKYFLAYCEQMNIPVKNEIQCGLIMGVDNDLFLSNNVADVMNAIIIQERFDGFLLRIENYRYELAKTLAIFELISKKTFTELPDKIQVLIAKNINVDFFENIETRLTLKQESALDSLVKCSVKFFKVHRDERSANKNTTDKFVGFLEHTDEYIKDIRESVNNNSPT